MGKSIYLNDEQYLNLLEKVESNVSNFDTFYVYDSTDIGNKYTTSNIGLCNDDYTDLGNAMFPKDFLKYGRKGMKYRKDKHVCPFDSRLLKLEKGIEVSMANGCYYTCSLRKKTTDKEKVFDLVQRTKELFNNK